MKRYSMLLAFSLLSQMSLAGTTLDTDVARQAVVFIYSANEHGDADKPIGTGFLVGVHSKIDPKKGALWLVTARHIVDPAWAFCSRPQPNLLYMRVNKKAYDPEKDSTGVEYLPIQLRDEKGNKRYFVRDDDEKVDAAAIWLDWEKYSGEKYGNIPVEVSTFASPEEVAKLRIGDSVVSAGLLPGRSGEKRNYPIFKFGEISSRPDEPTWIACEPGMPPLRLERVWFVAVNLVGGNSGSPVFYVPPEICTFKGVTCGQTPTRATVLGVQSSSVGDPQYGSADVAGMTPIEDVFKIIQKNSPAEVNLYRGDADKEPK